MPRRCFSSTPDLRLLSAALPWHRTWTSVVSQVDMGALRYQDSCMCVCKLDEDTHTPPEDWVPQAPLIHLAMTWVPEHDIHEEARPPPWQILKPPRT